MSKDMLPKGILAFLHEYHQIGRELTDLLDLETEEPSDMSPMAIRLHERYETLYEMAMEGDIRVGLRLARLGILANNLRRLSEEHRQIFSDFKVDFHEIEHNRYFGWRCEVDTAATLAKWDVNFIHPDPPDFQLERIGETVSIECTSAHYRSSSVNIGEKIKNTVSQKAGKGYVTPSTALFIDVTNIYHKALGRDEKFNSDKLKGWVRERVELIDMDIGSVILLAYVGQWDEFRLQQVTDRVDISPSDGLSDFLNEYIPHGEGDKKVRWFPPEP